MKSFKFSQVELEVGGEASYRCPRDARVQVLGVLGHRVPRMILLSNRVATQ
jgi:hypothetical protein